MKVDRNFSVAYSSPVGDAGGIAAVKAAYNACAEAFQRAGREAALVEVRVYAKPEEPRCPN